MVRLHAAKKRQVWGIKEMPKDEDGELTSRLSEHRRLYTPLISSSLDGENSFECGGKRRRLPPADEADGIEIEDDE
jgi:hypothetical protein